MILDMFKSEPKPSAFPRCQHRSPAGRQCSQPICSSSAEFCFTHKPKPEDTLIAELTAAAGSLSTPEDIHNFLRKVTLLRVQGRLTPKESCAYAYLCQILQRGQREIAFHEKFRREERERHASAAGRDSFAAWDLTRPDTSDAPRIPPRQRMLLAGKQANPRPVPQFFLRPMSMREPNSHFRPRPWERRLPNRRASPRASLRLPLRRMPLLLALSLLEVPGPLRSISGHRPPRHRKTHYQLPLP